MTHALQKGLEEYMTQWNRIVAKVRKNCSAKEEIIQSDWETLFQFVFDYDESDIDAQRTIKLGATERGKPDIILRKNDEDLFVVELKRHTLHDGQEQLFSYLNQLKMNLGVVVCDKLYLYDYDFTQKDSFAELEIPFEENNADGAEFVELFNAQNFDKQKIKDFITGKSQQKSTIAAIKSEITDTLIKDLLKEHFKAKYSVSDEDFGEAVSDFEISTGPKTSEPIPVFQNASRFGSSATPIQFAQNDLSKFEIIEICRNNGINIGDFTKSKLNKGTPRYWANPNVRFLSQDWWLILLNNEERKLYVLKIPANSIQKSQMKFKSKDLIDLQIYSDFSLYPDFEDSRSA